MMIFAVFRLLYVHDLRYFELLFCPLVWPWSCVCMHACVYAYARACPLRQWPANHTHIEISDRTFWYYRDGIFVSSARHHSTSSSSRRQTTTIIVVIFAVTFASPPLLFAAAPSSSSLFHARTRTRARSGASVLLLFAL